MVVTTMQLQGCHNLVHLRVLCTSEGEARGVHDTQEWVTVGLQIFTLENFRGFMISCIT